MDDNEFQWDDAKAAENYAKHGVTFEAACDVFKDPFAIDGLDESEAYGEARFVTIGMAEGRLLVCGLHHERRCDTGYFGPSSRAL
jgi:uncharacterized DUF497 family protein